MSSSSLENRVLYSILFSKEPLFHVSHRIFGCTCFVHDVSPGWTSYQQKPLSLSFLATLVYKKDTVAIHHTLDDTICRLMLPSLKKLPFSLCDTLYPHK